jgi:hypothetical protein
MVNSNLPPKSLLIVADNKDRKLTLRLIVEHVEKCSGLSLKKLKERYAEDRLFFVGLQYVTTTKKAYCEALDIPVEAGCRYKRSLEERELLVESKEDVICPYTQHMAKLISTSPTEFEELTKEKNSQIKLF